MQILRKIEQFYSYHGINLRTCYEDFDRHHMGVITESQVNNIYLFLKLRQDIC